MTRARTRLVAVLLCTTCSAFVSTPAVSQLSIRGKVGTWSGHMKASSEESPEDRVVGAIREGFNSGGLGRPKAATAALGKFGAASGELIQKWFTPECVEECTQFWADGSTVFARDLSRATRTVTRNPG